MASYSYLQADRITIMNGMLHDRWIAWVISATLFVSFALCVVSDLRFSASVNEAGVALPVSAGIMAMGVSWLLGHGLHRAAVIAVPAFFLVRNKTAAAVMDGEAY